MKTKLKNLNVSLSALRTVLAPKNQRLVSTETSWENLKVSFYSMSVSSYDREGVAVSKLSSFKLTRSDTVFLMIQETTLKFFNYLSIW